MIKTIAIAVVSALVVALAFVGLVDNQTSEQSLGAGTNFTSGISSGGKGITNLVDADGGTYTLTADELNNSTYFKMTASGIGQQVIALTFPATSTMNSVIPKVGECREWIYDASDLAAATTTTMTAGLGHNIIAYTANDDVIDGTELSEIRMCRLANGNINTFVTEMLQAD
jgi:hypothetical protein